MSDETAKSGATDTVKDALSGVTDKAEQTKAAQRAYSLYVRGMTVEAIASEVGASEALVALWVGDWAVRHTADGDPKRAVAGEALRTVLRKLWVNIEHAENRDIPKYASAIAGIEAKLVQLDGRCGAKVEGGYCEEYPAKGRTRCFNHGGGSLVGQMSGLYKDGRYSKFPFNDEESRIMADEFRRGDPFDLMLDDVAIARVMLRRAVAEGRSGVAELRAVNDTLTKYSDIVKGKKIVHVPDEAATRALFGAIYACVREAATEVLGAPGTPYDGGAGPVLALIAKKASALDWSKVNIEMREPLELAEVAGTPVGS